MLGTMDKPLSLPQPFEEIAHTADLSIRVRGDGREETLSRLLLALASLLSGGATVEPLEEESLRVEPGELSIMAVDVLREVLYLFTTEGKIPARCGVAVFDEDEGGEVHLMIGRYDEHIHGEGTDVKAVTFHQARFEQVTDGRWVAQVTLDI